MSAAGTRASRPLAALPQMMRKELIQLRRDRRMLPLVFVAPVIQLVLLGYAATLDVVDVRIVAVDRDRTPASRALLTALDEADNVAVTHREDDVQSGIARLERTEADIVLVTPRGLGRDLASGNPTSVHTIVDGSDSVAAGIGSAYTAIVVSTFGARQAATLVVPEGMERPASIDVRPRVLYNEELTSRNFMVPGVLVLILMIFTAVLTSMAIVREKETGTLEQLSVTPISRSALLLGKLLPFVLVGLVQSTLVVSVTTLWFEVPMRGSLLLLVAMILLFVVSTLAIGLFVSTVSRTQQQAMMTVVFFFFLPMMFFSGFVFPIENMPPLVQKLTHLVPLRHFLVIVRGVFLKGVGFETLWREALSLAVIGLVLLGLALVRFRKRLD